MDHQVRARLPRATTSRTLRLDEDPEIVAAFLSDAAHVSGGHSPGIAFPADEGELADAVRGAARVLAVGAQSSLTGGATPRGEVVVSTRRLTSTRLVAPGLVAVGAGVPIANLQRYLTEHRLYYPAAPTFDGAFAGGTIATNAAGPATFKYGSTREWVAGITVVLANGDVLDIDRGRVIASAGGLFDVSSDQRGTTALVPVPTYEMPAVPKLSAGYFAKPAMDLVDLFVGSEGTLGVVAAATLRVIPRPHRCVALVRCDDERQAIDVTAALRHDAQRAWQGNSPLDISAIEYIDARSLALVGDDNYTRAGLARRHDRSVVLLIQIETPESEAAALERLAQVLEMHHVSDDPSIASVDDDHAAARLFEFREAVPATVNALVGRAKAHIDPGIQKTAGDMIVPFDRLSDSMALYRHVFDEHGLDYAIWGHVSDGNLHPNVLPRSLEDVRRGEQALLEIARAIIAMGGAPLAEHGVGRNPIKQRMLREMYGEKGIAEMRAVKRALDPDGKLAPGVIFSLDD